ncbi:adenosylcobinamide-GDP ribazoletransferase [Aliterella atlantica]|uniref:Adenosylcobinamide-GDP ribazoletransferase n=1 Tax=Aliterella atlantica CENA595 TaxID=1618023 RepID=A0A0D8ZV80_9CYAN|nr:adenosylcobinamide-GDP ribazoletransferase [Aliterella atlantica]KJH71151.1 cobalamin synthase [Aliterella atlantica CENA595]
MKTGWCCWWRKLSLELMAAIAFYTCIPIPFTNLDFQLVARFAPLVGLIIGAILGILDLGLQSIGVPVLTNSVLVVACWILITGGLHLDGVMDTADGLAVQDRQRRLQVMSDSATGAFGAMAAIALLLIKTAALTELHSYRWLILMAACGWGRYGQQLAILKYLYLKSTGKGAFHKAAVRSYWDLLPSLLLLLGLSALPIFLGSDRFSLYMAVGGIAIAFLTGAWFNRQLGGHTGDTYGAVVEWTEALYLCLLTTVET